MSSARTARLLALSSLAISLHGISFAQTNTGLVSGTVVDPSGAAVPGAAVTIANPVSGLSRTTVSDSTGHFQFGNLQYNNYHLTSSASGFGSVAQDANVFSSVPVSLKMTLAVAGDSTSVTVEDQADLVDDDPNFSTNIDRGLFGRLPLESQSSALSSLVTLAAPGVAADSNGLLHGLGDHASNSFSLDGQPITDQQSKVFSNQIPSNAVQSLQVIEGAPPAEYGDKTSLIIDVTTRSGEGLTKPTGSVTASYGTFGSATGSFDLGTGGKNWGNFFEADGLNTGRFLDPPEFTVFHSKGNEENFFDRIDRQFTPNDAVHLDLNYTRSWFQNPNTFDNLNVQNIISGGTGPNPVFGIIGNTDQRSKIETFDIAPTYTKLLGANAVFNLGPYVRRDGFFYYPSNNLLADLGPIQSQSISQQRSLLNAGVHSDVTIQKGRNSIKAGVIYSQTFLRENDQLGIVNSTYNSPCTDATGATQPGFTDPGQCAAAGLVANDGSLGSTAFNPVLAPFDLTRGGSNYQYFGRTDVKELSLYVQDQIKAGDWVFNLGIRGDMYNGLSIARQAEPRLGASYNIKKTATVLRLSYARTLETPFNENLVLSSQGCGNDVLNPLLACSPGVPNAPLVPGFRNEFHAGLQQAIGKHFVLSGEYLWKYTHSAFDFSILGNTPIFFPIDWHNSKTPGFVVRASVPTVHGFSGFINITSVAARFFPPQTSGAGATVGQSGFPFRIDHDQTFEQTTNLQYQIPGKRSPWVSFNWRFDSGLNAASTPCYNTTDPNSHCLGISTTLNGQPAIDLSGFTADQEFEEGLVCNGIRATPTTALPTPCLASQLTTGLATITAPGTENDDTHPTRIAPRNLFDATVGEDDLFKNSDRYKWSLHLTGVNLANKTALYNFLSTFSGTHYVTPRTLIGEVGFHF